METLIGNMETLIGNTYNFCRRKFNVVATFEDGGETFCVVKRWTKYGQYWCYEVESAEFVEEMLKREKQKNVKEKKRG